MGDKRRSGRTTTILVAAALLLLAANISQAKYSGGSGEPNNPYRIATPNDLNDIGNHVEDSYKRFVLVNDINLAEYTGTQFNIIDNFMGVFDGNGHAISNFTYSGNATYVGLFGYGLGRALIKNLTLIDPNVNGTSTCNAVGGLVGYLEDATVRDCRIQGGRISGGTSSTVGGLIGRSATGEIFGCSSTAAVSGSCFVGGLVGIGAYTEFIQMAWIANCYSGGTVSGPCQCTGGLVGSNAHLVEYSYSSAQVAGEPNAGALVGDSHWAARYINCFWDSDVNPDINGIGNTNDPNVIGKTTTQMQTESTFTDAGWDFVEVWDIGEGQTYPFLRVYPAGDMNHDGLVDWRDFAILAGHWLEGTE